MSKDEKPAEKKKKGGLGKVLVMGIGAITLMGAGVGGGVYYAHSMGGVEGPKEDPNRPKLVKRDPDAVPAKAEKGKEAPLKVGTVYVNSDTVPIDPAIYEATYYSLEKNFTANLADGSGFVQVGLSLATYFDGKVIVNVQQEMVPIRSAILMVLSEQTGEELATPKGKKRLQMEITDAINGVLREKRGFGGIDNVYFTNLVIQ